MKRAFAFGLAATLLAATGPISAATFTVTNTNDAGAGSLRQAILDANGDFTTDQIVFAIPGSGVHTITLGLRASADRHADDPRRVLPAGRLSEHTSRRPGPERRADDRDRRDRSHRFVPA